MREAQVRGGREGGARVKKAGGVSKEGGRGQMGLFFVFDFPKPPL